MTTEEKNVEIAEMMGYKLETFYHAPPPFNLSWKYLMNVVEWIESLTSESGGYYGIHICSNSCTIQDTKFNPGDPENYWMFMDFYGEDKKEAVFEAIFAMSQHLKPKI